MLAVALVGLGVFASEPLYWWATTRHEWFANRTFSGDRGARGWRRVQRWQNRAIVKAELWYVETGFKAAEIQHIVKATIWHEDGTVRWHFDGDETFPVETTSPPWLWGVTDQASPTMPAWMKDDEKWQAALDAQE